MNTDTFWKLIENAQRKQEDGWIEIDHEKLIEALTQLSAEDIQEFDHIFFRMKANVYRADLWDAAYLVACGCGDDAFGDVGDWLIRMGREIYESVINNPENLADVVPRAHRFELYDVRLPERDITIMNVAEVAYERKMGEVIPYTGYEETPVLIGELMSSFRKSFTEEEIQAKYPRITEKLAKYSDDDLFDEDFPSSLG